MSFKQVLYNKHFLNPILIIFGIFFGIYVHNNIETHCNASPQDVLNFIPSASAEEGKEKKILYWTCGMAMALASVFIIPCLNAWHKEHKLKKALKKDPGVAETGMII